MKKLFATLTVAAMLFLGNEMVMAQQAEAQTEEQTTEQTVQEEAAVVETPATVANEAEVH